MFYKSLIKNIYHRFQNQIFKTLKLCIRGYKTFVKTINPRPRPHIY